MKRSENEEKQPKWLIRVQQQSWEPELLISGLILFALFQTPDLIDLLNQTLERRASDFFSNSTVNEAISILLKISVYILITGFITHILLRSVWVAYAGLSYLYKDGINFSKLNFPDSYTRDFSQHSYEQRVISLEKVCSGLFSASFLFFMMILGLINLGVIISLIVILLLTLSPEFPFINEVANFLTISIGFLFFIDLLTLGSLRRIPYVRTLYYPFYKVGRLVMLAPIYEDIYYGFLSNNKKWKLGSFSALFCAFFVILFVELQRPGTFTNSYQLSVDADDNAILFHLHYEDRIPGKSTGRTVIPSDVINGQVLRIFIPHLIENEANSSVESCLEKENEEDISNDQVKLQCLNEIYRIAINDTISTTKGLYQHNPILDIDGLVYWQDISNLSRGPHVLQTYRHRVFPDTSFFQRIAKIEFYKDSPGIKD